MIGSSWLSGPLLMAWMVMASMESHGWNWRFLRTLASLAVRHFYKWVAFYLSHCPSILSLAHDLGSPRWNCRLHHGPYLSCPVTCGKVELSLVRSDLTPYVDPGCERNAHITPHHGHCVSMIGDCRDRLFTTCCCLTPHISLPWIVYDKMPHSAITAAVSWNFRDVASPQNYFGDP
ncbi:hypothetical protein EV401DRAFT_1511015 [Pisolithus croceorrhizus]|nr:hypothetical protein EV401DRAFT_1511015 [Pisolithus croceorrhizus]